MQFIYFLKFYTYSIYILVLSKLLTQLKLFSSGSINLFYIFLKQLRPFVSSCFLALMFRSKNN